MRLEGHDSVEVAFGAVASDLWLCMKECLAEGMVAGIFLFFLVFYSLP